MRDLSFIDALLVLIGLAGATALAVGTFRNRTDKETIASQKGYIEALKDERTELKDRVEKLEGEMALITSKWGEDVGRVIAGSMHEAILPALDSIVTRLERLEQFHHE